MIYLIVVICVLYFLGATVTKFAFDAMEEERQDKMDTLLKWCLSVLWPLPVCFGIVAYLQLKMVEARMSRLERIARKPDLTEDEREILIETYKRLKSKL